MKSFPDDFKGDTCRCEETFNKLRAKINDLRNQLEPITTLFSKLQWQAIKNIEERWKVTNRQLDSCCSPYKMEKVKGIRPDQELPNGNSSFQEWNKNMEDAQNEL